MTGCQRNHQSFGIGLIGLSNGFDRWRQLLGWGALHRREREVLSLLARGMSNRKIGAELFISPKTASVHVSNILAKLAVTNRTEAAVIAQREGS